MCDIYKKQDAVQVMYENAQIFLIHLFALQVSARMMTGSLLATMENIALLRNLLVMDMHSVKINQV